MTDAVIPLKGSDLFLLYKLGWGLWTSAKLEELSPGHLFDMRDNWLWSGTVLLWLRKVRDVNIREARVLALQESIFHWEENLHRVRRMDTPRIFGEFCACCAAFRLAECHHCPIKRKVGVPECGGTPWNSVREAYYDTTRLGYNSSEALKEKRWKKLERAVQRELDFLIEVQESINTGDENGQ